MPPPDTLPPVPQLVADTFTLGVSLELKTEHIAFLAGLKGYCHHSRRPILEEEDLRHVFKLVSDVAHGEEATVSDRRSKMVSTLQAQGLLARVDGAGLSRVGTYSLTQLAKAIVAHFLTPLELNRRTLQILLARIRADLSEIQSLAEAGPPPAGWDDLAGRLGLVVSELIEGVDRRQRSMDRQQEEIRAQIGLLLKEGWFDAIERCETLLTQTGGTLRELDGALAAETHGIQDRLTDIIALAFNAGEEGCQEIAERLIQQMETITAWGKARMEAWSEYYQSIHHFIRDVVRMDPDRAVAQRLRDALQGWTQEPWYLTRMRRQPYLHMREWRQRPPPVVVAEASRDRETPIEAQRVEEDRDRLRARIRRLLARDGQVRLKDLLEALSEEITRDGAFVLAGELVQAMAEEGIPAPFLEEVWTALPRFEGEIQDLIVTHPKTARER